MKEVAPRAGFFFEIEPVIVWLLFNTLLMIPVVMYRHFVTQYVTQHITRIISSWLQSKMRTK